MSRTRPASAKAATDPAAEAAPGPAPAPPASTLGLQGPPGSGQFRAKTRRRIAYLDTVILGVAILGSLFIVWQLSTGTENLNDALVAVVVQSLTLSATNTRTAREYYFGASAPAQEGSE